MAPLVWLITGATSGIGLAIVTEVLSRGDIVIACGRNLAPLSSLSSPSLHPLHLDLSAPPSALASTIQIAWAIHNRIDIFLSNAGTSSMCTAEESTPSFTTSLLQTNLLAPLTLTTALLPLFRTQGSGILAYTSSSTAWAPLPFLSIYAASKAALSTYVEALHKEISPLGLKAVAFECGGFMTHLGQPREGVTPVSEIQGSKVQDYMPLLQKVGGMFASAPEVYMPGDLGKVGKVVVDVLKREGVTEGKKWVARVPVGSDGWEMAREKVKEMGELLDEWKGVAELTDREGHSGGTTREYLDLVSILGE